MSVLERKIISFLEKNKTILFLAIVTLLSILARYTGMIFESRDMQSFLLPWMKTFAESGMSGLANQVGDYNIPYQVLLAVLAQLPISKMYAIKAFSVLFDYLIAGTGAVAVYWLSGKESPGKGAAFYTLFLFSPTVLLNAAYWGQCDGIFSFFCLFSLLLLFRKKYGLSLLFLGFSLGFKLQTVFLLPVYFYCYIIEKRFSFSRFLLIPVGLYLLCIPGFLYGRGFADPLRIYISQTDTYHAMAMNFPSFWCLICGGNRSSEIYDYLKQPAMVMTVVLLGGGLLFCMNRKPVLDDPKTVLKLSIWVLWTCLLFLPSMHERYAYLMDLLLILLAVLEYRWIPFAVLANLTSLMLYGYYLFRTDYPYPTVPAVYLCGYGLFTWIALKTTEYHNLGIADETGKS